MKEPPEKLWALSDEGTPPDESWPKTEFIRKDLYDALEHKHDDLVIRCEQAESEVTELEEKLKELEKKYKRMM